MVDSLGNFSQQIDVVTFDRQSLLSIFICENETIIPESVYAVFEPKQTEGTNLMVYAQENVASIRRLHRTSFPTPICEGRLPGSEGLDALGDETTDGVFRVLCRRCPQSLGQRKARYGAT